MILVLILRHFLHRLIHDDDEYVIVQSFSKHDRKQRWVLLELNKCHKGNDVWPSQYRTHIHYRYEVQVPSFALARIVLALGQGETFEEAIGEQGQEYECEQGTEEAELRYVDKVREELTPSDIVASGKDNQGKQQVEKEFVIPLDDFQVNVSRFEDDRGGDADQDDHAGLVAPLEHFEFHVRPNNHIKNQYSAYRHETNVQQCVVRVLIVVTLASSRVTALH